MNSPDVIYLQWYGPEFAREFDSQDEFIYEGCTWCEDKINEEDVEYCQITKSELERYKAVMKIAERGNNWKDWITSGGNWRDAFEGWLNDMNLALYGMSE